MFPFEWQAHPLAYALGRALLHSLWQGAGLAVLLAAALTLLRGRGPQARYAAACAALALMLLLPALTVWKLADAPHDSYAAAPEEPAGAGVGSASARLKGAAEGVVARASAEAGPAQGGGRSGEGVRRLLPWLALGWLAGVALLLARLLGGLVYARRLRRQGVRAVGEFWQARAEEIARRLRLTKTVEVLESALVQVPTAVGWLRPVVLLPASALVGLTPQQLESILAHELAHIRRHDYLFNLLQLVAETLLFYHPAAWWVSRRVRAEREHVCDDLAVRVCGDALTYARALTRMERLRRAPSPQVALAASGGNLTSRVLRLVEAEPRRGRPSPLAVALCLAATLLTAAACTRAVLSEKGKAKAATPTTAEPARAATPAGVRTAAGRTPDRFAGDSAEGEDAEVRRAAVEALGAREGAVVVMDPRTGRVYAVVNQEWALRRGWAPASTMKLVVSLAGVGERAIDPAERVRVATRNERIDLTEALAFSDNAYFKSAGARVGAERIVDYARRLGLGEPTGINYEGEAPGRLPSVDKNTNSAQVGFGEGVEVTPVQLAVLVSALANGGTLYVPVLPKAGQEAAAFEGRVRGRAELPPAAREQVLAGMLAAVERGTASGLKDATLKIAGKTGTIAPKDKRQSIGWFASFAPADDPRLTVVVLTSGEGEKGRSAAQVAGSIYKALRARL